MSAKDRVSAATEATAESVREIRPLSLPGDSVVAPGRPKRRGRGMSPVSGTAAKLKETWLIPLGAAAVVAALALALVTLRHGEARQQPAPAQTSTVAPAATGIPRYYAIASEGPVSHGEMAAVKVTVGDVDTGQTVTTVTLPAVSEIAGTNAAVGVSAAADDRTFVVARRNVYGGITYFLVHIAPGEKPAAMVEQLPIPDADLGALLGLAVSPDGKELAVLSARGNGTTLRIYSVKSGATVRTWIAGAWQYQGNGQQQTGVSWTADGRQVAFSTAVTTGRNTLEGVLEERLIGATQPSGNLATASKLALAAPDDCSSLLLTPDGGTVVCATRANYPPNASPAGCGTNGPTFVAYSAATGQRLRVIYQYSGACQHGVATVLWSDDSAQHVIGETRVWITGSPPQSTDQFGVTAAGTFATFPVAQHGQWYSGPAF